MPAIQERDMQIREERKQKKTAKKSGNVAIVKEMSQPQTNKQTNYADVLKNENEFISEIANFDENYIRSNKYRPLNFFSHLNEKNELYQDNKLLIYNKGARDPHKLLYVTNQNETELN